MTKIDSALASRDQTLRDWTRHLGLWYVCDNAACRRACACRGNVQRCFGRNAQRVPQEVREWFVALGEMQRDKVPFDEAREWLDKSPVGGAFAQWFALTHAPRGNGGDGVAPDSVSR
jgi:hypothetical protein